MAVLTVVIPAYNAERTLEKTVKSVLAQTLNDIEIWIVDDGSADATAVIADRFAALDSRVHVIHQTNQRSYAARINALMQSDSKYFGFVDADDTVESVMYEKMVALAEAHDLDIVQCGVFGREKGRSDFELLTSKEAIRRYVGHYLIDGAQACFVWDKLYNRRLLRGGFEKSNILMYEDIKLNIQLFDKVARLGILHEGLYHYDVNAGSSVSNFKLRNVDDLKEIIETRARYAPNYGVVADDPRMYRWIVKNVRNYLISACAAPAESFTVRVNNVRAILAVPELEVALAKSELQRDACAKFIHRFKAFPLPLSVCALRAMKLAHRFSKRVFAC